MKVTEQGSPAELSWEEAMFLLSQVLRPRVLGDGSTGGVLTAVLKTNLGPLGADQCGLY